MKEPSVSIRDLRNHGDEVVDRVQAGEHLTITRAGRPVAELVPMRRPPVPAPALLDRWRGLPHVDARRLREDIDAALNPSL